MARYNFLHLNRSEANLVLLVLLRPSFLVLLKVVYILDQVPALEREMLKRIKEQGLDITPRILIVSSQADIRMIYAGLMTYMSIDLMLARCCYVLYIYTYR